MRRFSLTAWAAVALSLCTAAPVRAQNTACTTIQSGQLSYQSGALQGQPVTAGVNPYGYDYQAHSFSGSYFNAYAASAGFQPYSGDDAAYLAANPTAASFWAWPYRLVDVAMKWNDAWLSNKDCDFDGLLDRHYGFTSYVGSGAWLTNHNSWPVPNSHGKEVRASEFVKIVALPSDAIIAEPADAIFGELTAYLDGQVMGPQLWSEFAVTQDILNDPSNGDHGLMLRSQLSAGFGFFKNQ